MIPLGTAGYITHKTGCVQAIIDGNMTIIIVSMLEYMSNVRITIVGSLGFSWILLDYFYNFHNISDICFSNERTINVYLLERVSSSNQIILPKQTALLFVSSL